MYVANLTLTPKNFLFNGKKAKLTCKFVVKVFEDAHVVMFAMFSRRLKISCVNPVMSLTPFYKLEVFEESKYFYF